MLTEKGDTKTKTDALKKTIQLILNGEKMPTLLMTIIRFVMPSQDHMIKKLLLIFWEIVPKYTPDGKMLHEMILVCDAYRKVKMVCSSNYSYVSRSNLPVFINIYLKFYYGYLPWTLSGLETD